MKRFVHNFPSKTGIASVVMLSLFVFFAPAAHAASGSLEYAGWIPYWASNGPSDADAHISQFTEVNPFGYTVRNDGTLYDAMNVSNSSWQTLFRDARKAGVKVVPTVMWSDTGSIYSTLSDPQARAKHIQSIVDTVKQNNFDGVDIDYEGKSAETRDSFSAFLTELSTALYKANPKAELDCTIEARMPLSARYAGTPPANIEYANDLPTINKVCDRVRIMTYDQGTADLQLNASNSKDLYAPVADTAWVEKVVNYMSTDIDKKKMLIGVATYGAEYQAMANLDGNGFTYTKLSSFNPAYAQGVAQQYGITPSRGAAGELTLSYVDKNQTSMLPTNDQLSQLAPKGTSQGLLAALGALAYAKDNNRQAPVTYLTWSDAQAVQDKAKLAQRLGVAGLAIFKVDNGEDQALWGSLASVAAPTLNPTLARLTNGSVTTSTNSNMSTGTDAGDVPAGCINGYLYSPLTGAKCPVTSVPAVSTPPPVTTTPAAPSTASTFTRNLQFGMDGADVTKLQGILIKKGYLKALANGHFGPATKAALTAWQKAAGLPSTGYFGPLSRAKIGA